MNREAVWAAGLLLAVAAILIGVNLVLWPPRDPDGPPQGFVVPKVAPARLPPGSGPGVSPKGDGSGLPRDVTWYNLAEDRNAEPSWQMVAPDEVPEVTLDGATARVIAGEFRGLEIVRVVRALDDGAPLLEVGVGKYDRALTARKSGRGWRICALRCPSSGRGQSAITFPPTIMPPRPK